MAQIMEGQAFNTGGLADPLEGLGDRIGADAPHPAIDAPWQPVQDPQRRRGERHPPGRAGLRFRYQQHPGLTVQVVPAHGRNLPTTHGGFDGPGDEGAYLAAVGRRGGQEAGEFVVDEATVAATREFGTLALDEVHGVRQGLHSPCGARGVEEMGE